MNIARAIAIAASVCLMPILGPASVTGTAHAQSQQVIMIDPGTPETGPVFGPMPGVRAGTVDVREVVVYDNEFGPGRFVMVGHSFGKPFAVSHGSVHTCVHAARAFLGDAHLAQNARAYCTRE